jgi:hypothetical protein
MGIFKERFTRGEIDKVDYRSDVSQIVREASSGVLIARACGA